MIVGKTQHFCNAHRSGQSAKLRFILDD